MADALRFLLPVLLGALVGVVSFVGVLGLVDPTQRLRSAILANVEIMERYHGPSGGDLRRVTDDHLARLIAVARCPIITIVELGVIVFGYLMAALVVVLTALGATGVETLVYLFAAASHLVLALVFARIRVRQFERRDRIEEGRPAEYGPDWLGPSTLCFLLGPGVPAVAMVTAVSADAGLVAALTVLVILIGITLDMFLHQWHDGQGARDRRSATARGMTGDVLRADQRPAVGSLGPRYRPGHRRPSVLTRGLRRPDDW